MGLIALVLFGGLAGLFILAVFNFLFVSNPFMGSSGIATFQTNALMGGLILLILILIFIFVVALGLSFLAKSLLSGGGSKNKLGKKALEGIFTGGQGKSIYGKQKKNPGDF